ncbi:class II aldolase/adducin family protein [Halorussus gelatinilyticus]|uniref:Class II aldolase/adducin family protein n=1 Tax=Halorussus gelatinilyticus TaxID=2937524 RepID=A0A8U0INT3_9EURY|nr:class II aldolase/adducin family protein [Halorussus gelatinilyticus]UPW01824.1 class II aldolase/adducin family protein [Halorussus gelatinilyticus]
MLGAERRAVATRAPDLAGLTPGRTGNLSVRRDDRFAVTPTGVAYDRIDAADVPVVSLDGEQVAGDTAPSSETPMHSAVYREFDAGAIVHTHSPWASTLAILHEPIPPVHYMLALAGTTVPVADYATYGTAELAANAVEAMEEADADACLLANHGLLATGDDADSALETAVNVEYTARIYCQAKAFGDPVELSREEMAAVAEKFEGYGQDGD